jgi:hypothetical protein
MRQELGELATVTNRHKVLLTHLLLIVAASLVVDAIGTLSMYYLERHTPGSEIHTVFDAFFFTTVQLLTV